MKQEEELWKWAEAHCKWSLDKCSEFHTEIYLLKEQIKYLKIWSALLSLAVLALSLAR